MHQAIVNVKAAAELATITTAAMLVDVALPGTSIEELADKLVFVALVVLDVLVEVVEAAARWQMLLAVLQTRPIMLQPT